ncbi:transcriptional regulator [Rodentibacter caecimuris]|uniref:Transcriptional regulator n=1 Tax=Rodentibacter caecimuris TaxID=1796644 RepID=A0AAJ3K2C7_9PAST|nr:helix-turn-helix transcriptional regulator [Rodentibacter heylii]AOF52959.1 putative transcriptional regulators [Pasteurellaceae bacterium NI1060]MCQ9123671.1 helix-turn-helix domain-containing protein [Rodentibacter heylii]MCX2961322.1 helix-turn-helix domain-containing protein [Rodentibacter heylii]OOF71442.1 transcriptional regulator [Rodentibacter heylii]OOF76198.1 transcriptional regulator [Rodentibacter heylii]
MSVQDKIRGLREQNRLSQEEMAERLNMSPSGYAKIERGETKLYLEKLEQIAQVFNLDITDLINTKNICFLISENSQSSSNYYNSDDALIIENEKLKLSLSFQEQLIEQQKREIALLKEMNALLKA